MCSVRRESHETTDIIFQYKSARSLITFGVQLLDLLSDVLVGLFFWSTRHVEVRRRLARCRKRLWHVALHHWVQTESLVVGGRSAARGTRLVGRLLLWSFFKMEHRLLGRIALLDVARNLQLLMVGASFGTTTRRWCKSYNKRWLPIIYYNKITLSQLLHKLNIKLIIQRNVIIY